MNAPGPAALEADRTEATGSQQGQWRRFLRTWLGATAVLLLAVAGLNAAVDPFLVFGSPLIAGFNQYKPATQGREALAKPALLLRVQPRTVLIGTSKVQVGLDPLSAAWRPDDQPVFNAGLPGATAASMLAVLQDSLAPSVHRVLVLLEPADLIEPAAPFTPAASFRHAGWSRAQDLLEATLTRDALEASLQTMAAQWTSLPSGLRPDGQMYDGTFRGPTLAEGPGALFGQKMPQNADRIANLARRLAEQPGAPIAQLDAVRQIIALCREKGVSLDIALAPVHADLLRLVELAGLWPRYLLMRQELARTVAEAGGGQVRLWSFAGFNDFSTEPVPLFGQHAPGLQWFWEPNHFRAEYGNLILETIYRGRGSVGTLLTQDGLASEAQTAAMEQDRAAQPGEWSRAAAALAEAQGRADRR